MIKRVLSLLGAAFLALSIWNSCTDEIQVTVDRPLDKPIIFCLLNPNDSVQYLRLQKIFLGETNAAETARITDSIYYSEASVMIREIGPGQVARDIPMTPTFDRIKEDGLFATAGHYVFETREPIRSGYRYELTVELPDYDQVIHSEAVPFSELEVTGINRWPNGINMINARFAQTEWISVPQTETYQLTISYSYYELTATDTVKKTMNWTLPRVTSLSLTGGETMSQRIPIDEWYLRLADHITPSEEVTKRISGKFDYTWYFAGEPLESYMTQDQTTRNGLLSDYPQYSNIDHAIGVFSYRSGYTMKNLPISLYTLERLTTHPATQFLKFDGRQYW